MWNVPVLNKDGNLHYLVAKLAEVEEGEELYVELKHNGAKSFIDVQRSVGDLPSIDVDENSEENPTGVPATAEDEDPFDASF